MGWPPKPLVSVIIPTYQRCDFLPQAIESVIGQAFSDWELIVVDDGSFDETPKLLQSVDDGRVRAVRQPNQGVSAARNHGVRLARGRWLAFLDSDDSWKPRKLQRQIEVLEEFPEYRAVYTDEIWIRRGRRVNPRKIHAKYSGWIYRRCLPLCIISPSSILLDRRLLEELGGFDQEFPVCEDYDLWLRLSARHPVLFLNEQLIVKRGGHPGQLSRSVWGLDRFRLRALVKAAEGSPLSVQQKLWTACEIERKARIVAAGAARRGNRERARRYSRLATEWSSTRHSLAVWQRMARAQKPQ